MWKKHTPWSCNLKIIIVNHLLYFLLFANMCSKFAEHYDFLLVHFLISLPNSLNRSLLLELLIRIHRPKGSLVILSPQCCGVNWSSRRIYKEYCDHSKVIFFMLYWHVLNVLWCNVKSADPPPLARSERMEAPAVPHASKCPRICGFALWNIRLVTWKMQASIENRKTKWIQPFKLVNIYIL